MHNGNVSVWALRKTSTLSGCRRLKTVRPWARAGEVRAEACHGAVVGGGPCARAPNEAAALPSADPTPHWSRRRSRISGAYC
jgi:hypothetical protein